MADYERQSYWRDRFANETSFEWLISSDQFMAMLEPLLQRLPASARILHVGFGTSDLQNHLRAKGFINIVNVDYEPLATERGRELEEKAFGDVKMEYSVADATQLKLDHQYDLVIDKSTADAVSCAGEAAIQRMASGVRSSLASGGVWVSMSYSSDRFHLANLPFEVQVLDKIVSPKFHPSELDFYYWCYLLKPI